MLRIVTEPVLFGRSWCEDVTERLRNTADTYQSSPRIRNQFFHILMFKLFIHILHKLQEVMGPTAKKMSGRHMIVTLQGKIHHNSTSITDNTKANI